MKIIINGKIYNLSMTVWDGSDWIVESAEDIVIDSSYIWDEVAEAWMMKGDIKNLLEYLGDWSNYNTDVDRDAYDEETRENLKEEYPRHYELEEK